MNSAWLKTRQTKFTAYTIVYVLIVVAVVGGLNFLANRYRQDLRRDRRARNSHFPLRL